MFIKNWKKEILTLPNLLSLFRLILIPVYIHIYLNATKSYQYYVAGTILAVSCLTDAFDGIIARRFNQISTVGKILDPLADKATQFALTLCLSLKHPVLYPVLVLFILKELFQVVIGLINLVHGKMLPGALAEGKICTTILFISLIMLVFFPKINSAVVEFIAWTDGVFLMISFIGYFLAYFGKEEKVQDFKTE